MAIYAVLSRFFGCDLRALVWRKNEPKIVSVEKKGQISCMHERGWRWNGDSKRKTGTTRDGGHGYYGELFTVNKMMQVMMLIMMLVRC